MPREVDCSIEIGETPEGAIRREILEELGLETQRIELIGHFVAQFNQLIIAHYALAEGEISLSQEIADVRSVPASELARFDFGPLDVTREIVSRWLRQGGAWPALL